ncbi:MAG: hypothetical protein DWQ37_01435 [Planctomycetota bacterium]|nr:MAG: hypothetical protein DWQ37_01435 [Planctomycetota bacterium]
MDDPHGASSVTRSNRLARRLLLWSAAAVCAVAPATARGQQPAAPGLLAPPSHSNPLATSPGSERLPPVTAPTQEPSILFGQAGPGTEAAYAGQQVNYVVVGPDGQPIAGSGPVTLVANNRSLMNFAGIQTQEPAASGPGLIEVEGDGPPDGESEAEAEAGQGGGEEEQTFGQAPPNNNLQFLRQVDVLLKPGAWQADTGFIYTHFSNDFPLPVIDPMGTVTDVAEAQVRRRLLFTPLAVRYGLTKNIQLFATLPAGFSNTQLSAIGLSETRNVSGLGDGTFGASIHLIKGEHEFPDVIGTVGFTAPTGKFDTPLFGLVPGSNLGQGFWAYNVNLLCINRYDPVIVFYGGGYRHLWERPFDGVLFAPGEQANYLFGAGFAINDRITFSSTFQGFYITNTYINNENVRGSNLEPLSLRFALTVVRNCRILEPFCQIGLTDSAPNANVGIIVTYY